MFTWYISFSINNGLCDTSRAHYSANDGEKLSVICLTSILTVELLFRVQDRDPGVSRHQSHRVWRRIRSCGRKNQQWKYSHSFSAQTLERRPQKERRSNISQPVMAKARNFVLRLKGRSVVRGLHSRSLTYDKGCSRRTVQLTVQRAQPWPYTRRCSTLFCYNNCKETPSLLRMCTCVFPSVSFGVTAQVLAMTSKAPLDVPTPETPTHNSPLTPLCPLSSSPRSHPLVPLHVLFSQPEMLYSNIYSLTLWLPSRGTKMSSSLWGLPKPSPLPALFYSP